MNRTSKKENKKPKILKGLVILIIIAVLMLLIVARSSAIYKGAKTPLEVPNIVNESVSETFVRTITAYTLSPYETDDSPCIGAFNDNLCVLQAKIYPIDISDKVFYLTGERVNPRWRYICASNEFPRGTILRIGKDECIVYDRMNSRYKNRIDILMNIKEEAFNWGIRELEVEVIN